MSRFARHASLADRLLWQPARRFVHPGIAESAEDIARARRMIAEKREPWYGCFKALEKCWSADPNQKVPEFPARLTPLDCNRTIGSAGRRAHDLALMYRLTDDERYAVKAVKFINANSHYESLDERGTGPLDYGKIYLLVEAAELLRSYKGWAKEETPTACSIPKDQDSTRPRCRTVRRWTSRNGRVHCRWPA